MSAWQPRLNGCVIAVAIIAANTPWSTAGAVEKPAQTLHQTGSTALFAQVMDWFGSKHFAVGRWDGTVSLFRTQETGEFGPVLTQAFGVPSGHGVEMLTAFNASTLVTSDGADAVTVWRRPATVAGDAGQGFMLAERISFDKNLGSANSGTTADINGIRYLATGHENGWVVLWQVDGDGHFRVTKTIDVRSPNHPANPWGISNVRGLAIWQQSVLVTGSEDGDLVGISLPDGAEIFRKRYNASAQRGINSISITGQWLLVANCSVGPTDKNVWLFDLSTGKPVLSDAENLALDTFRSQTFNFDADLFPGRDGTSFVSSTEEGLIWKGDIEDGQLVITGIGKSSPEGGSVIDVSPDGDFLAAATYAIRVFALP